MANASMGSLIALVKSNSISFEFQDFQRKCSSRLDIATPMTYIGLMKFIETSIFTKQVHTLLPNESYRMLQSSLMIRPDAGAVIKGSGGLRKVRWKLPGSGKRGALRLIYYWDPPEIIYMIFLYKKTEQKDLTPEQIKILKTLVEDNLL